MHYGKTEILICKDEHDLGVKAASAVASKMRQLLTAQEKICMIFAAGESQMTFLDALAQEPDIDWNRIICFNMDDFWDMRMPERFTCGYQTRTQLYDMVKPKSFHLIKYDASDPYKEARRFERLLRSAGPIDILCQGIGTSGHLALNEPYQTDFEDPSWVRVVDIAEQSRRQLIDDPNFKEYGNIPEKGITMTIPALLSARHIYTMAPLALKQEILTRVLTVTSPSPALPATILSTVGSTLYLDINSCPAHIIKKIKTDL